MIHDLDSRWRRPWSAGERDAFFHSRGGKGFGELAAVLGIDAVEDGRSFAWLDFDRDGWLDLANCGRNTPALRLYRSRLGEVGGKASGFVAVRLVGGHRGTGPAQGWSNRDGIGARIEVEAGGTVRYRERQCGEGFAAQNSATLLVGLGDEARADRIRVRWPSGRTTAVEGVASGTLVTLAEDGTSRREPYAVAGPRVARSAAQAPRARLAWAADSSAPPVRLLSTYATWCEACAASHPRVRAVTATEPGVPWLGVAMDPRDTPERLAAHQRRHPLPYRLLPVGARERERLEEVIRGALGSTPLPSTLALAPDGTVLEVRAGIPSLSDVRRLGREASR